MREPLLRHLKEVERRTRKVERIETPRSWGAVLGSHLGLPRLRGFWPMGAADASDNVNDLSGDARHMIKNGTVALPTYNNFVPYADYDGSTGYHARATEAALEITGVLTLGGWFWFDRLATDEGLFNKIGAVGNRSYGLQKLATGNEVRMAVSGDGTALIDANTVAVTTGRWYFIAGRYVPSTEVAIFLNDVKVTDVTSVPASLFNSTAALEVGRLASGIQFLDGRSALNFICAANLSDTLLLSLFTQARPFFGV